MAAYNLQLKRKTASALENVYVSTKWELVDGKPSWIGSNKPSYTWSEIGSKPTTFNPSSHSHGNITNDGKIGTTANRVIVTGTGGVLTAKAAGSTSQFLRGDGSWATPTASASTNIDYNWLGEHEFQKQITLTGDLSGVPKYPSIKAKIYTPEGAYTREWMMPNNNGTLATLDDIQGGGGMTYSFSSSHVTYASGYDSKSFVIDSDTAFIEIHFHSGGQTHTQYMLSRAAIFSNNLGIVMPDHMIYPASPTNMGVECMFTNGGYIGVIQHKFS